jgi:hypothetical protein
VGSLTIDTLTKALFVFWLFLLLPWLILAPMSGMAFDAGYTVRAYIFSSSVLTYPVSVIIAGFFGGKQRLLILLPCLNILGAFSDLLWKSS